MRCPTLTQLPAPITLSSTGWPWTEESPQLPETLPNGQPWPKISIVTPSYNQGQFIEETIRSVLLQGYPNLEYIVIDGGSTDQSVDIIKRYGPWLTYWVSESDDGQSHAINKGMEIATGSICNWLNSDDYLLPEALSSLAEIYSLLPHDAYILAAGGVRLDVETNTSERSVPRIQNKEITPFALPVTGGIQASWFFTKEVWNKIGSLDLSLSYSMDVDMYLRCRAESVQWVPIEQVIAVFRIHRTAKTYKAVWVAINERRQLLRRYLVKSLGPQQKAQYWLNCELSSLYLNAIPKSSSWIGKTKLIIAGLWQKPSNVISLSFWSKVTVKLGLR